MMDKHPDGKCDYWRCLSCHYTARLSHILMCIFYNLALSSIWGRLGQNTVNGAIGPKYSQGSHWAKVQSREPRSFVLIHNVDHLTDHEYLCKNMVSTCNAFTLYLSGGSPLAYWSWVFIQCLNIGLLGIVLLGRFLIVVWGYLWDPTCHHRFRHIIVIITSITSLPASHHCHHHALVSIMSLPASCHC